MGGASLPGGSRACKTTPPRECLGRSAPLAFAAPALPAAARRSLHPPNTTRPPVLPTRDEVSGRLEREAAEADRDAGGADHEEHASPPLETPGLARDAQAERKRGRHGVAVLAVRGKEAVLHAETARDQGAGRLARIVTEADVGATRAELGQRVPHLAHAT